MTTVGVDYKSLTVEVDEKRIKLEIWDTAGQERFRAITVQYWRTALGIFLLYCITDRRTFENCKGWLEAIRETALEHVEIMLVGNRVRVKYLVFIL